MIQTLAKVFEKLLSKFQFFVDVNHGAHIRGDFYLTIFFDFANLHI
jgi:hypothetical protein